MELAVACITSPRLGTTFAIDSTTALTAWHCVRDPDDDSRTVDSVELRFLGEVPARAEVGPGDPTEDWALLMLSAPLPASLRPIPLRRDVGPGAACRCLGFPIAAAEFGYLPILVTVSGETRRAGAALLTLEAATVGTGLDVRGMSGGPVVPRRSPDEAVGLVSRRLLDLTEEQVGVLFACPSRAVVGGPVGEALGLPVGDDASLTEEGLAAAADRGDTRAAARLGHLRHAAGDDAGAGPYLRQAALGGDPAAAYTLGMVIDPDGTLIHRDPASAQEALAWFRRAATGGDVYGATTMGIRLHQHGRDDAALPWLEEAVERGADAMAAHTLGRIYEGWGHLDKAEQWERFAARRGDSAAASDLARILENRG